MDIVCTKLWYRDRKYLVIAKCDHVINFGEETRAAPKISQ